MKKLIIYIAVFSFFACSKSDEMNLQFYLDRSFEFSIFSSQNEDLLDPATTNHYEATEIKLFYKVDGEMIEVYDSNMEFSRNFLIYKHENEYRIRVFLNDTSISEKPVTYIKWNNNDTDTIEAIFERNEHLLRKRKVWLNGLEIWDWTTDENGYYRLIK
jgi:hypothetical protein